MSRVVVLGGGYAGLACLIDLCKKDKSLDLHLVDAATSHCKITNLHKTFRDPVKKFSVDYAELADRYNFIFHHQPLRFTHEDLNQWQQEKSIPVSPAGLPFDWLIVSTGAAPVKLPGAKTDFGQNELRRGKGRALLEHLVDEWQEQAVQISLVGGGATGIQVLFELHEQLRRREVPNQIRLIDLNPRLIANLPEGVHKYIARKMQRAGIDYLPQTRLLGQNEKEIQLEEAATGRTYALPSDLTLQFPGVTATPFILEANAYGQVLNQGQLLPDIFTAGDCSKFHSAGLNFLTAQAAVRKGKLVARNISRLHGGQLPLKYRYREKGYLISLGSTDAIGWVGLRRNLVKGFPASILKEAMETQYDLFLDGIDTYIDFP